MTPLRLGLRVGPFILTAGPPGHQRPRIPFMLGPTLVGLAVAAACVAAIVLAWWLL